LWIEFADLIMTAGKEVEVPIARFSSIAFDTIEYILIITTQRPSVNVITGLIKQTSYQRLRLGFL
jgi:DNA segregation ATPase FtsK/SpoIIIE-like protein